MSLLDDYMQNYIMINKQIIPDGYGGYKTEWVEGAEFQASVTYDDGRDSVIADKSGVIYMYNVVTSKDLILNVKDVFRRLSDGKTFIVTRGSEEYYTPKSATLYLRKATAEEFTLTNE